MKIKMWGVRGSIPCPGPDTVRYGGNTLCLEVRFKDPDRLVIIDAGSGIRQLGNHMVRHDLPRGLKEVDIFLTHTHWDHILGFPFFAPMYIPGMTIRIHGPAAYEENFLERVIGGQFMYRYFPVRIEELSSTLQYIELGEDVFDLGGGLGLTTKYLNHPVSCLGYRFEYAGKSLVTAFDTEPFQNLFSTDSTDPSYDPAIALAAEETAIDQNNRVEQFYAGADLVLYDAQYTREEYLTAKKGWGHSSIEDVIEAGKRNGLRRLALIHHDPERTDDELDSIASKLFSGNNEGDTEVFFAREGMEIDCTTRTLSR